MDRSSFGKYTAEPFSHFRGCGFRRPHYPYYDRPRIVLPGKPPLKFRTRDNLGLPADIA